MSEKTSKLLRKVAKLSGRTDTYIKQQFKQMKPHQKKAYILFAKENIKRINSTPITTVTDIPQASI